MVQLQLGREDSKNTSGRANMRSAMPLVAAFEAPAGKLKGAVLSLPLFLLLFSVYGFFLGVM